MLTAERRQSIMELLEQQGNVSVKELCDRLGVSEVTIRKDLNYLCDQGLAQRMYGGAMKRYNTHYEQTQDQKAKENVAEKKAIAAIAFKEIKDGETILFNGGTTSEELIRLILEHDWKDLTIVTNSLAILLQIISSEKHIDVILLGGKFRYSVQTCVGNLTEMCIKEIVADRVFISSNGISCEFGVTCANAGESAAIQLMMHSSIHKYLLSTSAKFGKNAMYRTANVDDFGTIITDDGILQDYVEQFRNKNCRLLIAPRERK